MSWSATLQLTLGTLHLDVALAGERIALVGPNGAGKSSVLKALIGALHPRGRICVGDTVLFDDTAGIDLPPEQRRIAYVPQHSGLFPHLSVLDNVRFAAPDRRARTQLEALDLLALADRMPPSLSGGERQRVALARALAMEPRLVLLDEPLSAVDVGSRRALRTLLADALQNRDALFITHDARDVRALDAHVVVLDQGRVVQQGSWDALAADPANAFVAELFGP